MGLYLNRGEIKAQRTLEMFNAIQLAMNAEPGAIGDVMLAAGQDLKSVSRWVMSQRIAATAK